jgi:predicted nuclease of restriction endonuclease-like (RecB) superfamily
MNNKIVIKDSVIEPVFKEISDLITEAKQNVRAAVNSELVLLYWNIGKKIKTSILKNKKGEYGKYVVKQLSEKLTLEFGKGYSRASLFRMIRFYEVFPDNQIVATVLRLLSWSHFIELIKIDEPLKREFYIQMCINEKWPVRTLQGRINSMLFERTAISKKPEKTILNDLELLERNNKMTPDLTFRDPYLLDFLDLDETFSETELERAILSELQKFILEMGTDFAFLARQKRIIIDNDNYFLDLLFYHRKMRRLVAIELKLGRFKHSYKSQMELYLKWLEKYEKNEGEENPLGLILCAEKSDEVIELLELDRGSIRVAQYLTELPPKEIFKKKLQEAIIKAKAMLASKTNGQDE